MWVRLAIQDEDDDGDEQKKPMDINEKEEEKDDDKDEDSEMKDGPPTYTPIEDKPDVLADSAEYWYDIGKRYWVNASFYSWSLIKFIERYVLGKDAGMEVAQDLGRGIDCIRRAADMGHDAARWDLECFVGEGDDMRLDFTLAVKIYQRYRTSLTTHKIMFLQICGSCSSSSTNKLGRLLPQGQRGIAGHTVMFKSVSSFSLLYS